ncbi:SIR2 family protein [Pedobacter agri]|uniref:SIR2 family protein n=1 Tax=Pedobacter agri TaxID=454586 RepID=UPI0029311554|nr:SIR2 family protein [Pedobacter agri]
MNNFDNLKHVPSSITYLSTKLNEGNIVLFLGAGASRGFGLPNWVELVNGIRKNVLLDPIPTSATAQDLQLGADEILDELKGDSEKLISLIETELYQNFDKLSMVDAFNNHLLVSISAMLMGSKRGRVTRVITLNYDSMLEWFLSLFGFVVKTVHSLPDLEGSEDVRIYHPHGFVPIPNNGMVASDFIILGMDSVNKRLGTPGNPWFEMTRHILNSGLCLFIGMSENTLLDSALAPLFKTCGDACISTRPLGLWLLGSSIHSSKERAFERNNIVPIVLNSHDEIPEYLLKICQGASNLLNKK